MKAICSFASLIFAAIAPTTLNAAAPAPPAPVNPCAASHRPVFYANDFGYLGKPGYDGQCLGDTLKLMPVADGDWGTLDLGGQVRERFHHERGMGQSLGLNRFEDTTTNFWLTRVRTYANWKASDNLRIFAEGIFADTSHDAGLYTPRPIDVNRADILNLFADLCLTHPVTFRAGRSTE